MNIHRYLMIDLLRKIKIIVHPPQITLEIKPLAYERRFDLNKFHSHIFHAQPTPRGQMMLAGIEDGEIADGWTDILIPLFLDADGKAHYDIQLSGGWPKEVFFLAGGQWHDRGKYDPEYWMKQSLFYVIYDVNKDLILN